MDSDPSIQLLEYTIESREDFQIGRLRGAADYEHLPILLECFRKLRGAPQPLVVLDLSELAFIASATLGALVSLQRALETVGHRLVLASLQPNVRDVFRTTRLDMIFNIAGSLEEACAAR